MDNNKHYTEMTNARAMRDAINSKYTQVDATKVASEKLTKTENKTQLPVPNGTGSFVCGFYQGKKLPP